MYWPVRLLSVLNNREPSRRLSSLAVIKITQSIVCAYLASQIIDHDLRCEIFKTLFGMTVIYGSRNQSIQFDMD